MKERTDMVQISSSYSSVCKLMSESGTISHITPDVTTGKDSIDTNISIKLVVDSNMQATIKGGTSLNWNTHEGVQVVQLCNTLVTRQAAMRLLSIPRFVNKNIAVLFLPGSTLVRLFLISRILTSVLLILQC